LIVAVVTRRTGKSRLKQVWRLFKKENVVAVANGLDARLILKAYIELGFMQEGTKLLFLLTLILLQY
jgi:Mg/Co/Ni transporter MgtE